LLLLLQRHRRRESALLVEDAAVLAAGDEQQQQLRWRWRRRQPYKNASSSFDTGRTMAAGPHVAEKLVLLLLAKVEPKR
jgi:hypothetical protein